MSQRISLPIDPYLEQLTSIWQNCSILLVKATPGSGKTTRLPWKLAQASDKRVVVLEPRRLAAKLAASRIVSEENLELGQEVGYHFRYEKNHSAQTKLIFYTEGTFLRLLLNQQELQNIGTVILDEFHERHIETDLAFATLRSLQHQYGFKLILMSATLDSNLMEKLPQSQLIEITAKQYNVQIQHLPNVPSVLERPLESKVRAAVMELPPDSGDILVFVPGMREMLRCQQFLGNEFGQVFLLHADLSKEEQEAALGTSATRKIILATNIAESSVTIPGIRVVIDSGIQRESVYSPWTGLRSLEDRAITQSSAIQRTGRAGRTADGICLRLYSEQDFQSRPAFTEAEILKADLTDTYLLAAQFNTHLDWPTTPPADRWKKAQELLFSMGAVNSQGSLTAIGKKMIEYPVGARFARAMVAGEKFTFEQKNQLIKFLCQQVEKDRSGKLQRKLSYYLNKSGSDAGPWEKAILEAFVDQVARYRVKQHDFIHYSGKTLRAHSRLEEMQHDYYLILEVTPRMEAYTVVPIEEEWIYLLEPFPFTEEEVIEVDEKFKINRITRLGSISMEEFPVTLDWNSASEHLKSKIIQATQNHFHKKWKAFSQTTNFLRLHFWARFHKIDWHEIEAKISVTDYFDQFQTLSWDYVDEYFNSKLEELLSVSSLDQLLPIKINLGGKRDLTVHYPYELDPFIEAPIQDFYGLTQTPSIMSGKFPLSMKLLGPHKRAIQVTKDIQSFWKNTYQQMKKELQRDYPRHHWPDNPEIAKPILLKRELPT